MLSDHLEKQPGSLEAPGTAGSDTYVTFELGSQTFGISVAGVREILDLDEIHRVPNAPEHCEGVIDARGASVPVINLGKRLGLPHEGQGPETRIIVVEIAGSEDDGPIGVIADRVLNVSRIALADIEAPPAGADRQVIGSGFFGITRVDGRFTILLEIAAVLNATTEPC